jgi:hypothetical protein
MRRSVLAISTLIAVFCGADADTGEICSSAVVPAFQHQGAWFRLVQKTKALYNHLFVEYPYIRGQLKITPCLKLNLQPGELVRVKSKQEILATLDTNNRNRGLSFDVEMLPFCGKTFRVLRRVEQIINERNGRMMRMPNDCIVLENVTCGGCLSSGRLFCPRSIYPYWREIWLKRVEQPEQHADRRIAAKISEKEFVA